MKTCRGEVALGALHRGEIPGGQAAVVEVQGVVGRELEDGPVHGLGAGRQVGVEPEAERHRAVVGAVRRRGDREAVPADVVLHLEEQ